MTESNPDFSRIIKTVSHIEPDRVPLCEVLIEYPIQSKFLGREVSPDDIKAQIEFWSLAGYDFIPIVIGMMTPGKVTDESPISRIIRTMMKNRGSTGDVPFSIEYKGLINNRRDFETFPWELASELDFTKIEKSGTLLPDGMKVIAVSGKIFTLAWMLMGFENFAVSLMDDENLVGDLMKNIADIQFHALDRVFKMPHVGAVWVVDDIAGNTGPIIPPSALRDHVFPWYSEMARKCHERGMLFFMHSDGDLMPVMEDIIGIGVDVLQPIDPSCMDIIKVKEIYGSRISICGNVSNELLRSGTPAEIEKTAAGLIDKLAPGGGYMLGSGNSVVEWSKFENYMAMRAAAFRYGSYR